MKKIKSLLVVLLFSSVVNGQELTEKQQKVLESVEFLPYIGISVGHPIMGTDYFKTNYYGIELGLVQINFSDKISVGAGSSQGMLKYNQGFSRTGGNSRWIAFYGTINYKPLPKIMLSANMGVTTYGGSYFEPKITYRKLLWDLFDVFASYRTFKYTYNSNSSSEELKSNIGIANIGISFSR